MWTELNHPEQNPMAMTRNLWIGAGFFAMQVMFYQNT
jgi:hypothetical protein